MLSCGTIFLVITLNLILVDSHVILPASEINLESEKSTFNAFIDNSENNQDSNFESNNNETSKNPEDPQDASSPPTTITNQDKYTVIHVPEHHKKEPSKVRDFPLSEFHKDESTSILPENDHQPATVESASKISRDEKAIETKTMKTERESTARKQKENFSTTKSSEQSKINKTETFSTIVPTTKTATTIKPKPTPSNATSLKISFVIFLMTIFACYL